MKHRALSSAELAFLPNQPPICDWCGSTDVTTAYAASRMSTGEQRMTWRWVACSTCTEFIEQERWAELLNRMTDEMQRRKPEIPRLILRQAVSRSLADLHEWGVKTL